MHYNMLGFFLFSKHSYQALEPSNVNVHMRMKQSVKYIYVLTENNIDMQINIKTVRKGLYRQANMHLKKNYLNFSKFWLSVSDDFLRKLTRNYTSER